VPDRELTTHLLEQAVLAPSSHNTQPWVFEVSDDLIRLHADRTRALPANDPDDRELTISCGCALLNLRAAAKGVALRLSPAPERGEEDLLAEVRFDGDVDADLAPLARAIPERRTYRKRFAAREVGSDAIETLTAAAHAEGAWLDPLLEDDRRETAAALVAEGDAAQWADARWRRELAAWMHPRRSGDGLALPWLAVPVAKVVVRTFDMGNGVGAKDQELAEASPLLAVLGTGKDSASDWLRAGQALERVLLAATNADLQASYLNQPVQVSHLRPKLQNICDRDGFPQILLRIGYPEDELPAAPRRPVDAVVE